MGRNDHLDDSELANLPPEAYGNTFDTDGPFDPDNHWLRGAEREQQLIAMREWFLARYCAPAMDTPYNGREGGYLFIHGGPYDPGDVLPDRFSSIVDDSLIQDVIDEMHGDVGEEWAPIHHDYDDRFDLPLLASSEPLRRLRERLQQSQEVLALQGDPEAKSLAEKLVFSAAIGALEAFLWETAHFWIENDDLALRDFITKLPVFRDESIKLGDLFKRHEGLKHHVKGYLQNMVWHRWDKVAPLFRDGLNVNLPSFKSFDEALVKRHDIVHRSGHDKQGLPIEVTIDEICDLCSKIETFAIEVDKQLAARGSTDLSVGADAPDF
ncbi:MAG: hypothetical protein V4568_14095 [Pseudomonadota bacterium]